MPEYKRTFGLQGQLLGYIPQRMPSMVVADRHRSLTRKGLDLFENSGMSPAMVM
jgi:hypothetical protein